MQHAIHFRRIIFLSIGICLSSTVTFGQSPAPDLSEPRVVADPQGLWSGPDGGLRRAEIYFKVERNHALPRKTLGELIPGAGPQPLEQVFQSSTDLSHERLGQQVAQRRAELRDVAAEHGLDRIFRLSAGASDPEQLAKSLATDPRVAWAEPVVRFQTQGRPGGTVAASNDPFLSSTGSWGQGELPDLWGHHRIRAAEAWEIADGSGVLVAVIDSGCDLQHPDLAPNLWTNPGEIEDNVFVGP